MALCQNHSKVSLTNHNSSNCNLIVAEYCFQVLVAIASDSENGGICFRKWDTLDVKIYHMDAMDELMLWNGTAAFRICVPLWEESTSDQKVPLTKSW